MKIIKILLVLAVLSITPAYSQVKSFKIDKPKSLMESIRKPYVVQQQPDYSTLLNNGKETATHLFPKSTLDNSFGIIEKSMVDNMPLLIPEGRFYIRNFKPDTTVRYSMKIKRIQAF